MVAGHASTGNREAQAPADVAIANASPGGKHQNVIPDLGTGLFNFAKCFLHRVALRGEQAVCYNPYCTDKETEAGGEGGRVSKNKGVFFVLFCLWFGLLSLHLVAF